MSPTLPADGSKRRQKSVYLSSKNQQQSVPECRSLRSRPGTPICRRCASLRSLEHSSFGAKTYRRHRAPTAIPHNRLALSP